VARIIIAPLRCFFSQRRIRLHSESIPPALCIYDAVHVRRFAFDHIIQIQTTSRHYRLARCMRTMAAASPFSSLELFLPQSLSVSVPIFSTTPRNAASGSLHIAVRLPLISRGRARGMRNAERLEREREKEVG
jgi:hypothetical protein